MYAGTIIDGKLHKYLNAHIAAYYNWLELQARMNWKK